MSLSEAERDAVHKSCDMEDSRPLDFYVDSPQDLELVSVEIASSGRIASDWKSIVRMKAYHNMIRLADKLVDNDFQNEAEDVVAQVLELNDISGLTVVTPEHPLYPVLQRMLRPGQAIEDKLAEFSERLALG